MSIFERVRLRVPDTELLTDDALCDLIDTITDRLNLRLGTAELPSVFETICADATVKMYRRTFYEGISSEGVANITTSFVEDILAEYDREISDWINNNAGADGTSGKVVHFL